MDLAAVKEWAIWETLVMLAIREHKAKPGGEPVVAALQQLAADAGALRDEQPEPQASAAIAVTKPGFKKVATIVDSNGVAIGSVTQKHSKPKDYSTVNNHKPNCPCVYHRWLRAGGKKKSA